jgi:hypothetical protein
MTESKVDYSAIIIKAVAEQLESCGLTSNGITAASRKGDSRSIPDVVSALRKWLESEHPAATISIPQYDKSWGPLNAGLLSKCSDEVCAPVTALQWSRIIEPAVCTR